MFADEVVLHDQPSSFYCFRLEFPPDQSQINARASASGNSQKIMSDLPVVITLAAFSTEVVAMHLPMFDCVISGET